VSSEVITALGQMISRLESINQMEHQRTREILREYMDTNELVKVTASIEVLTVSPSEESHLRKLVARKILDQLFYPSMTTRYEAVAEAYPRTFEWAFRDSTVDQRPWSNLAEWLKTGSGVYWIRGKAGAGKSTLMKHIYNEPKTERYLKEWAAGTEPKDAPLCIATFFFWNSGSTEQKSQKGLLRALLYQVLEKHEDLTSLLFPDTWAKIYSELVSKKDPSRIDLSSFSESKLLAALSVLVNQKSKAVKLFFLIDGLDEFDGDHEELSELFKDLTLKNSQMVKACLSSRPLVVFDDCFASFASLQLQNLTYRDIEHFVQSKVRGSPAFRKLETAKPEGVTQLIKEIVEKAEGVFLWVNIVVKSLLSGIRNKDSILDLIQRLRLLPRELEPLYAHLLSSIDPFYMKWASSAFQIMRTHRRLNDMVDLRIYQGFRVPFTGLQRGPLSLFRFFLAIEEGADCMDLVQKYLILQHCEDLEARLRARCAGLLEVSGSSAQHGAVREVGYLHRTAKDFIEQEKTWGPLILLTTNSGFKPQLLLVKSHVMSFLLALKSLDSRMIEQMQFESVTGGMVALLYLLSYTSAANLQREDWEDLTPLFDMLEKSISMNNGYVTEWMTPHMLLLCPNGGTYQSTAVPELSFLEIATVFQLTEYTKLKLKGKSQAYLSRCLRLVLYCSVSRSTPWDIIPQPTIDCILTLISLGAIPYIDDKSRLQSILDEHMPQTSYRYARASSGWIEEPKTDDAKLEIIDGFIDSASKSNPRKYRRPLV
jgi:disulfide oxidoreductase YuzD